MPPGFSPLRLPTIRSSGTFLPTLVGAGWRSPPFFRAVLHELADAGGVFALEIEEALAGVAASRWRGREPPLASARADRLPSDARAFPARGTRTAGRLRSARREPPVRAALVSRVCRHRHTLWQRRGFGRTILAPVLARADDEAVPSYLETPFPNTRAFYKALGFEETDELRPILGPPPIWTVTRAAAPKSASTR